MAAIVTTARGEQLNMDDLIAKSRKPLDYKETKAEVKPRKINRGSPINVMQGYVPGAGEDTPKEIVPESVVEETTSKAASSKKMKSAFTGEEARSMADLTGVKIEKTSRTAANVPAE